MAANTAICITRPTYSPSDHPRPQSSSQRAIIHSVIAVFLQKSTCSFDRRLDTRRDIYGVDSDALRFRKFHSVVVDFRLISNVSIQRRQARLNVISMLCCRCAVGSVIEIFTSFLHQDLRSRRCCDATPNCSESRLAGAKLRKVPNTAEVECQSGPHDESNDELSRMPRLDYLGGGGRDGVPSFLLFSPAAQNRTRSTRRDAVVKSLN